MLEAHVSHIEASGIDGGPQPALRLCRACAAALEVTDNNSKFSDITLVCADIAASKADPNGHRIFPLYYPP